jgi:hypothetical protein
MFPRSLGLIALLTLAHRPDEGQWLPQQVLAMDWSALQARGLTLSKDELWHPERGGILSAAVQLGGCSASFVSAEGLVVTNHHCGFGAVQSVSTVEQNYLRDGFVAQDRAHELPAAGLSVYVVRRIEDVTEKVRDAQANATDDLGRWNATQSIIRQLTREGEKEPNTTCQVASFLEGQQYLLYYRTRISDVRLVYAPPRAVGEFGGEEDNWEWPRHTGDFTFFRAYVAPDGTPRGYHEDNVPYRPEHWLRVAGNGVHDNDLVLILGYPGRTERYLTSIAVADRQGYVFPMRYRIYSRILEVLERASARDEQSALGFSTAIKSLSNTQKNALGMIRGLKRNAVVEHKRREEAEFQEWVASSPERTRSWGSALADVVALDRESSATLQKDEVLRLLSGGYSPWLSALVNACAELGSGNSDNTELPARTRAMLASDELLSDFDDVQRPILEIMLDEARSLPAEQRIAGSEALSEAPADVSTHELLGLLLARSKMRSAEDRVELFSGGAAAVAASDDPFVQLARGIAAERSALAARTDAQRGRRLVVGQRWIEAQEEWRGKTFYPDANGTLRVSIATVKGYAPHDGAVHLPHTTVAGVLEKETGATPFASPPALLAAAPRRSESRFFDAKLGDVPVCFLSDGDTTGGNSGSPVINGKGELVGLNFDRVFENVAGDYGWLPERSRNISVDIRYALWIMDQVLPAPHLLAELGV